MVTKVEMRAASHDRTQIRTRNAFKKWEDGINQVTARVSIMESFLWSPPPAQDIEHAYNHEQPAAAEGVFVCTDWCVDNDPDSWHGKVA